MQYNIPKLHWQTFVPEHLPRLQISATQSYPISCITYQDSRYRPHSHIQSPVSPTKTPDIGHTVVSYLLYHLGRHPVRRPNHSVSLRHCILQHGSRLTYVHTKVKLCVLIIGYPTKHYSTLRRYVPWAILLGKSRNYE